MPSHPFIPLRRRALLAPALAALFFVTACDQGGEEDAAAEAELEPIPETAASRISYGAGYTMADSLREQLDEDFDGDAFGAGVEDALAERDRRVDDAALSAARDEIVARRRDEAAATAEANLEEAQAFLRENAQREGVSETESGLQYRILEAGEGESPELEDMVVVHYTGRLRDGTVFDSSVERGQPARFQVDRVIPGWQEALQLMEAGDRWRIWLPPDLAYGAQGAGEDIPPNAALVFDVELLEVDPQAEQGEQPQAQPDAG